MAGVGLLRTAMFYWVPGGRFIVEVEILHGYLSNCLFIADLDHADESSP